MGTALKKKTIVSFIFILSMAGVAVTGLMAQNPGTAADPLVSKSYVDHFLRFRSVALPANTVLQPDVGTMIVVRSGQLRLEASSGKSVIDLTAGRELSGNIDLPHNHLIIVPESAGIVFRTRKLTMLLASFLNEEQKP